LNVIYRKLFRRQSYPRVARIPLGSLFSTFNGFEPQ